MEASMCAKQPLWEHFVVCGLAGQGLQTVTGEKGFLGTDHKYKPHFLDSVVRTDFEKAHTGDASTNQPPPQLPLCCLPAGVDIVLHQDLATANLAPHTFSFVLTEGDGTKVYANCLSFYDKVSPELCAKHEDLLGAKALKAICLLSHQPYLVTTDKVLRELHHIAFVAGSMVPIPEIIGGLLAAPCPQLGGAQVCLQLGFNQHVMWPPLAIGPPPGELPLQSLVEVLRPDSLVGLFAAVLLEQRVLLRSRQHWLLTVVAEGIVRLLHPFKYQHVYIPVMPCSLTDYLEAPTPFLMGLHSSEAVAPRTLEGLVAMDLDAGSLSLGKDDSLLQRCLAHPYMLQLKSRVRMLMQPSVADVDVVGQHQDPWVLAAQQIAKQPWGPCKQALLLRMFLEFFNSVLADYQTFLVPGSLDGSRSNTSRSFAAGGQGQLQLQPRLSASAAVAAGVAGLLGQPVTPPGRVSAAAFNPARGQSMVDMRAVLDHHSSICRHSDPALLQQVMQGLPFMSFVGEYSNTDDPQGWLKAAEKALSAWRVSEEQIQATAATRAGTKASIKGPVVNIAIPQRPTCTLAPAGGLLYASFPSLVVMERHEGPGLRLRRKNSSNNRKRTGVGKRRAISELMGSQIDLRRHSPVPGSTNTDALAGRALQTGGTATSPVKVADICNNSIASGGQSPAQPSLLVSSQVSSAPAQGSGASVSGSSSSCSQRLELVDYIAEAELVRRQTGLLLQLMQPVPAGAGTAAAAAAAGSRGGRVSDDMLSAEDLEAARLLLCVQTGGNGWFLVSRLKEIITTGATISSSSIDGTGKSTSSSGGGSSKQVSLTAAAATTLSEGGNKTKQASPGSSLACSSVPVDRASPSSSSCINNNNNNSIKSSPVSSFSKPPSPSKSTKLFGVNISSISSNSSNRPASPPGMKVSHSVESFANAASAMASALSASVMNRSLSLTKGRPAAGSNAHNSNSSSNSSSNSPGADIKANAAFTPAQVAAVKKDAGSSKAKYAAEESSIETSSEPGIVLPATSDVTCDWTGSLAAPAASAVTSAGHVDATVKVNPASDKQLRSTDSSANATSAAGSPVDQVVSSTGAAAGASAPGSTKSLGKINSSSPSSKQVQTGCLWERCVSVDAFAVLGDMMNAITEAAAVQDDFRVVLAAMELACVITCQPAFSAKSYLVSCLAGNTSVHTEWFWAGAFSFAVSSSYLQAQELVSIRDVVVRCLAEFARYMTAVGICGTSAWLALLQLATEHLTHQTPLEPEVLLNLRAHVAHQENWAHQASSRPLWLRLETAANCGSSSQSGCAANSAADTLTRLPADVLAGLQACGADVGACRPGGSASGAHGAVPSSELRAAEAGGATAGAKALTAGAWRLPHSSCTAISGVQATEWDSSCEESAGECSEGMKGSSLGELGICSIGSCSMHSWARGGLSLDMAEAQPPLLASSFGLPTASAAAVICCEDLASVPIISPPTANQDEVAASHQATAEVEAAGAAANAAGTANKPMLCSSSTSRASPRGCSRAGLSPREGSRLSPRDGSRLSPRDGSRLSPRERRLSSRSPSKSPTRSPSRGYLQSGMQSAAAAAVVTAAGADSRQGKPSTPSAAATAAHSCSSGSAVGSTNHCAIRVEAERGSLLQQGSLQWAALHKQPVVAVDASSYTVLSAGLDGVMQVADTSTGHMRLSASMNIPELQGSASSGSRSTPAHVGLASIPVLKLWRDGSRAAVGNAREHAVWVVDMQRAAPSVELSGLGSSVSSMHLLQRNRDALLTGLSTSSCSCSSHVGAAAVYLWDLRKPKKPAASLDLVHTAAGETAAGESSAWPASSVCCQGVSCLAVHDDGVMAAAGCKDGRALVWDMRKPSAPLSTCVGHQGAVSHVQFVPTTAAVAAGSAKNMPLLVTASDDWTARVWDAATGRCKAACIGHGGPVTAVQVLYSSTAGTRLVTGAADGCVAVWGLQGELCSMVQQHGAPVQLLAQGVDAVVSGAADKSCHTWSLSSMLSCTLPHLPQQLGSQQRHASICCMAHDPVAELLCCGHRDGLVSLWNCSYSRNMDY